MYHYLGEPVFNNTLRPVLSYQFPPLLVVFPTWIWLKVSICLLALLTRPSPSQVHFHFYY